MFRKGSENPLTFLEHIFISDPLLIHFSPMSHFYTPRKRQKTIGFRTFSGGIEM